MSIQEAISRTYKFNVGIGRHVSGLNWIAQLEKDMTNGVIAIGVYEWGSKGKAVLVN